MKAHLNETDRTTLQKKIRRLVNERGGILLAHNYQRPEVQDIADLCGDSLELSIKASRTVAEVIVFCGVHFMAETAAILCPDKKILLPVLDARCPMADMVTAKALRELKQTMTHTAVISYVNTTAEVKAESDLCCTSANAIQVANSVDPADEIFMTPDKNLAQYTKTHTERKISYWDGYCPVHDSLTAGQVMKVKKSHPEALFLAHPECPPDVLELADKVRSTSGMLAQVSESDNREFIIATETGLLYPMSKLNPDKVLIPADPKMICEDMKKIRLEDILRSLETMEPEVKVPEQIRQRAKKAVDRMLQIPLG